MISGDTAIKPCYRGTQFQFLELSAARTIPHQPPYSLRAANEHADWLKNSAGPRAPCICLRTTPSCRHLRSSDQDLVKNCLPEDV